MIWRRWQAGVIATLVGSEGTDRHSGCNILLCMAMCTFHSLRNNHAWTQSNRILFEPWIMYKVIINKVKLNLGYCEELFNKFCLQQKYWNQLWRNIQRPCGRGVWGLNAGTSGEGLSGLCLPLFLPTVTGNPVLEWESQVDNILYL